MKYPSQSSRRSGVFRPGEGSRAYLQIALLKNADVPPIIIRVAVDSPEPALART